MKRGRKIVTISAIALFFAGGVTVLIFGAMSAVADRPSDDQPTFTIELASPPTGSPEDPNAQPASS